MKVIPLKLSDSLAYALDGLVNKGIYNSRNEALRDAARYLIERMRLVEAEEKTKLQVELQAIAQTVAAILQGRYREAISRIILFGSVARGNVDEESDIDLLIVIRMGDRHDWRRKFIEEALPITYRLGHYISIKTFTEKEFKTLIEKESLFIKEVLSYGIDLYRSEASS